MIKGTIISLRLTPQTKEKADFVCQHLQKRYGLRVTLSNYLRSHIEEIVNMRFEEIKAAMDKEKP